MSWKTKLAAAGLAAAGSVLMAQETSTTVPQSGDQNTQQKTTTTTTQTTVTGDVLRYEPGRTIVVRDANNKTVTYTIDSGLAVPADVQVGHKVTLYTSPADGSIRVQRITSVSSTNPDGSSLRRTEVRDSAAPDMSAQPAQAAPDAGTTTRTTTTKTTTINGTVQAYEPGQSITVLGPGNKTTVYTISTDAQLPQDVAVGKQVTMQTMIVSGKPVVRSVTTRTTTTKTTKSSATQ